MSKDDLQLVNHALKELTRLQLDEGMDAQLAWQERRAMLAAVEENWQRIPEVAGQDQKKVKDDSQEPVQLNVRRPALWVVARGYMLNQRFIVSAVLLLLALMTFIYVGLL
ncbi:MAG: hypothetical protein U0998_02520 [Moraxellaceae bacterium]|nr:hypothetical protein [Moraxellaceae bacterium]MDP1776513.1 hypothetical protein [Moraxellaceae bacterium]MDZ4297881.1 hypothetical protein [Moraxellaceae bacterium]MDZ4386077.1 hypothetical protein [Moraxellaceae bacterium]